MMMVMVLVLMMTMKTITVLWQTKTSSVLSVSSGIFSFSSCDQTFLNCAFIFISFRNNHYIITFLSCHYYFQQNLPDSWWLTRCYGEVRSSWEVSLTFCFVFASPSFKISFGFQSGVTFKSLFSRADNCQLLISCQSYFSYLSK